jgi:hypothetical protein
MSLIRNKTVRRSQHDSSGAVVDFSVNTALQNIIEREAENAYKKPWHRLERGLRLNRIRLFTEDMAKARGLKPSEKTALQNLLIKALDKKLLNSKTAVEYDAEEEKIKEIKPLVMHQNAAGEVLFQLLEKRNAVTFRKRGGGASSSEAAAEGASSAAPAIEE